MPVKFQSDWTILNTNLAASRLYEILRKDVFSDIEDIETGPSWQPIVQAMFQYRDCLSRHWDFHFKDKTVVILSYRYNGNPYTSGDFYNEDEMVLILIRQSWDQLIFIMQIPILVRQHLYIEIALWSITAWDFKTPEVRARPFLIKVSAWVNATFFLIPHNRSASLQHIKLISRQNRNASDCFQCHSARLFW